MTVRAHAETVACPRGACLQPNGQTCVRSDGTPYSGVPAHDERVQLADHTAALRVPCGQPEFGGCTRPAGQPCVDVETGRVLTGRHRDHKIRLQVADVWREPLTSTELAGWPHRLGDDVRLARGRAALNEARARSLALARRVELKSNERAGELSQAERYELLDIDALLAPTPPEPAGQGPDDTDDDDHMDYRIGPGGRR